MISGINTGCIRCPFQSYSKTSVVEKKITENGEEIPVQITEARNEFGECFKERCMAFDTETKRCLMLSKDE